ncbi:MAG: cyclase family protein [Candidatus Hodarchaeota archaeon]
MRKLLFCLFTAIIIIGCSQERVPSFQMPKQIVDLSATITEDLPVRLWGHKLLSDFGFRDSTRFEHITIEEPLYVQNSYLEIFNHGGTHVDGPNHLERGAMGVDGYKLNQLIGRGRIIDLRSFPPDEPVGRSVIEEAKVMPGEIVIVLVGYEPPKAPDALPSYPYLSSEAAKYLAEIPVKAFATDAWSIGNPDRLYQMMAEGTTGYEAMAPAHHAFLTRHIPIIEALENVEQLVGVDEFVFVGFPLKIADSNASPIRAAALVF